MKATRSGRDANASDDTISPVDEGKVNAGIVVPNGNIVEGVAVIAEPQYSEVAGWSGGWVIESATGHYVRSVRLWAERSGNLQASAKRKGELDRNEHGDRLAEARAGLESPLFGGLDRFLVEAKCRVE